MRRFLSKKVKVILIFSLLFLSACGEENLYENLTERDANEIMTVLKTNGIEATKLRVASTQETTYMIQVEKKDLDESRQILVDNNLPRENRINKLIEEVCGSTPMIVNPEHARCQRRMALTGQIIRALESDTLPEIKKAHVVLNLPETIEFQDPSKREKPSAFVTLRVKKSSPDFELKEADIQRAVADSVPNLDPRDVTVLARYVGLASEQSSTPPPVNDPTREALETEGGAVKLAGLMMGTKSVKRFRIYAVAVFAILLAVCAALILNILRMTKMRQELRVLRAQEGGPPALDASEKPMLEEGEGEENPQLKSGVEKGETANSTEQKT